MILNKIRNVFWTIGLIPKLGVWDVSYVAFYRVLLKSGILKRKFPTIEFERFGQIFTKSPVASDFPNKWEGNLLKSADKLANGFIPYYSFHWMKQTSPPNWFVNPFNGMECLDSSINWTQIPDFRNDLGDIKNLWEASRFSWVSILARAYAVTGKDIYLNTMNVWIQDWSRNNPLNQGPNWKCGQEASIRVLHLLNVSNILKQSDNPSEALIEIIALHLRRICLNHRYAFAQRNNHATSEAAALYIGGNWLSRVSDKHRNQYLDFARKGRDSLEVLVRKLIYDDGSFSQHSMNYHRLFLDTLSILIFWNRKLSLPKFTKEFYKNGKKAVDWMFSVVDESGRCPNLGANDGTMLLGNHSCDYLDYRPSIQTASVLLKGQLAFNQGPWNEVLYWFGISMENFTPSPFIKKSTVHKSGYVVMKDTNSWALLRFPFYRFRPSHNDVFHFDLWANGENLIFDSGTYSYNADKECNVPDLRSVHSHNSLSFDQREQMPRLGRFLVAKWIKAVEISDIIQLEDKTGIWEGSYRDSFDNLHFRQIKWNNNIWELIDRFSGSAEHVEIGYNFQNCEYSLDHKTNTLLLTWGKISISSNADINVCRHLISRHYMHSSKVYRLVISTRNNTEITTTIKIF